MLDMLARSNLPQEQVAHLRSELEKAKKPKRKDMQDYSMFGLYLPDKLWQKVLNRKEDQMSVLDAVVTHLAEKMGLRCPHEPHSRYLVRFAGLHYGRAREGET